jgi:hypothetical protein
MSVYLYPEVTNMQCACAILSSVGMFGSTIFFHIISCDFRGKKNNVTVHKMCVLIYLQILSEVFITLRRTEREMIEIIYWSSCEVPVILVKF